MSPISVHSAIHLDSDRSVLVGSMVSWELSLTVWTLYYLSCMLGPFSLKPEVCDSPLPAPAHKPTWSLRTNSPYGLNSPPFTSSRLFYTSRDLPVATSLLLKPEYCHIPSVPWANFTMVIQTPSSGMKIPSVTCPAQSPDSSLPNLFLLPQDLCT